MMLGMRGWRWALTVGSVILVMSVKHAHGGPTEKPPLTLIAQGSEYRYWAHAVELPAERYALVALHDLVDLAVLDFLYLGVTIDFTGLLEHTIHHFIDVLVKRLSRIKLFHDNPLDAVFQLRFGDVSVATGPH